MSRTIITVIIGLFACFGSCDARPQASTGHDEPGRSHAGATGEALGTVDTFDAATFTKHFRDSDETAATRYLLSLTASAFESAKVSAKPDSSLAFELQQITDNPLNRAKRQLADLRSDGKFARADLLAQAPIVAAQVVTLRASARFPESQFFSELAGEIDRALGNHGATFPRPTTDRASDWFTFFMRSPSAFAREGETEEGKKRMRDLAEAWRKIAATDPGYVPAYWAAFALGFPEATAAPFSAGPLPQSSLEPWEVQLVMRSRERGGDALFAHAGAERLKALHAKLDGLAPPPGFFLPDWEDAKRGFHDRYSLGTAVVPLQASPKLSLPNDFLDRARWSLLPPYPPALDPKSLSGSELSYPEVVFVLRQAELDDDARLDWLARLSPGNFASVLERLKQARPGGLTDPPKGVDPVRWEKSREAALAFLEAHAADPILASRQYENTADSLDPQFDRRQRRSEIALRLATLPRRIAGTNDPETRTRLSAELRQFKKEWTNTQARHRADFAVPASLDDPAHNLDLLVADPEAFGKRLDAMTPEERGELVDELSHLGNGWGRAHDSQHPLLVAQAIGQTWPSSPATARTPDELRARRTARETALAEKLRGAQREGAGNSALERAARLVPLIEAGHEDPELRRIERRIDRFIDGRWLNRDSFPVSAAKAEDLPLADFALPRLDTPEKKEAFRAELSHVSDPKLRRLLDFLETSEPAALAAHPRETWPKELVYDPTREIVKSILADRRHAEEFAPLLHAQAKNSRALGDRVEKLPSEKQAALVRYLELTKHRLGNVEKLGGQSDPESMRALALMAREARARADMAKQSFQTTRAERDAAVEMILLGDGDPANLAATLRENLGRRTAEELDDYYRKLAHARRALAFPAEARRAEYDLAEYEKAYVHTMMPRLERCVAGVRNWVTTGFWRGMGHVAGPGIEEELDLCRRQGVYGFIQRLRADGFAISKEDDFGLFVYPTSNPQWPLQALEHFFSAQPPLLPNDADLARRNERCHRWQQAAAARPFSFLKDAEPKGKVYFDATVESAFFHSSFTPKFVTELGQSVGLDKAEQRTFTSGEKRTIYKDQINMFPENLRRHCQQMHAELWKLGSAEDAKNAPDLAPSRWWAKDTVARRADWWIALSPRDRDRALAYHLFGEQAREQLEMELGARLDGAKPEEAVATRDALERLAHSALPPVYFAALKGSELDRALIARFANDPSMREHWRAWREEAEGNELDTKFRNYQKERWDVATLAKNFAEETPEAQATDRKLRRYFESQPALARRELAAQERQIRAQLVVDLLTRIPGLDAGELDRDLVIRLTLRDGEPTFVPALKPGAKLLENYAGPRLQAWNELVEKTENSLFSKYAEVSEVPEKEIREHFQVLLAPRGNGELEATLGLKPGDPLGHVQAMQYLAVGKTYHPGGHDYAPRTTPLASTMQRLAWYKEFGMAAHTDEKAMRASGSSAENGLIDANDDLLYIVPGPGTLAGSELKAMRLAFQAGGAKLVVKTAVTHTGKKMFHVAMFMTKFHVAHGAAEIADELLINDDPAKALAALKKTVVGIPGAFGTGLAMAPVMNFAVTLPMVRDRSYSAAKNFNFSDQNRKEKNFRPFSGIADVMEASSILPGFHKSEPRAPRERAVADHFRTLGLESDASLETVRDTARKSQERVEADAKLDDAARAKKLSEIDLARRTLEKTFASEGTLAAYRLRLDRQRAAGIEPLADAPSAQQKAEGEKAPEPTREPAGWRQELARYLGDGHGNFELGLLNPLRWSRLRQGWDLGLSTHEIFALEGKRSSELGRVKRALETTGLERALVAEGKKSHVLQGDLRAAEPADVAEAYTESARVVDEVLSRPEHANLRLSAAERALLAETLLAESANPASPQGLHDGALRSGLRKRAGQEAHEARTRQLLLGGMLDVAPLLERPEVLNALFDGMSRGEIARVLAEGREKSAPIEKRLLREALERHSRLTAEELDRVFEHTRATWEGRTFGDAAPLMRLVVKQEKLRAGNPEEIRTLRAEALLGKDLTAAQKQRLQAAHELNLEGGAPNPDAIPGLDPGIGSYSSATLRAKYRLLRNGDLFSPEQARALMEAGIAGESHVPEKTLRTLAGGEPRSRTFTFVTLRTSQLAPGTRVTGELVDISADGAHLFVRETGTGRLLQLDAAVLNLARTSLADAEPPAAVRAMTELSGGDPASRLFTLRTRPTADAPEGRALSVEYLGLSKDGRFLLVREYGSLETKQIAHDAVDPAQIKAGVTSAQSHVDAALVARNQHRFTDSLPGHFDGATSRTEVRLDPATGEMWVRPGAHLGWPEGSVPGRLTAWIIGNVTTGEFRLSTVEGLSDPARRTLDETIAQVASDHALRKRAAGPSQLERTLAKLNDPAELARARYLVERLSKPAERPGPGRLADYSRLTPIGSENLLIMNDPYLDPALHEWLRVAKSEPGTASDPVTRAKALSARVTRTFDYGQGGLLSPRRATRYRSLTSPRDSRLGDFIENGTGDCRHQASLLQLALQQEGIRSRLVVGDMEGERHAWVVADDGQGGEYLLDPTHSRAGSTGKRFSAEPGRQSEPVSLSQSNWYGGKRAVVYRENAGEIHARIDTLDKSHLPRVLEEAVRRPEWTRVAPLPPTESGSGEGEGEGAPLPRSETEMHDREALLEIDRRAVDNLNAKGKRTRATVLDALLDGEEIAIDNVIVGSGPAATQALLARDGGARSRTLVVAEGFSKVYARPGDKTGGSKTIGKNQDNSLLGGFSRVFSSVLKRAAYGEDSRGNNEVIGTVTKLHMDGAVSHLLLDSRVVAVENAALARRLGNYGEWRRQSPFRLKVEQRLSRENLNDLAEQLGIEHGATRDTGALAKEIQGKLEGNGVKEVRLFVDAGGEPRLEHFVYTGQVELAVGLPEANIYVKDGAGRHTVAVSLADAARAKARGEDALIATADQKKDMTTDPTAPRKGVIAGAGDSSFVILQREMELAGQHPEFRKAREEAVRANQGKPLDAKTATDLLKPYIQYSLVSGPDSTMQARNVEALFDQGGPYFGRLMLLKSSALDVHYVDADGNAFRVESKHSDGRPKTPAEVQSEIARARQVRVTLAPPAGVTNLAELAAYFHKSSAQFLSEGFLPESYFKTKGDRSEANLRPEMMKTLLDTSFAADGNYEARLKAQYGERNVVMERDPNGKLTGILVTSDYLGMASGYNGEATLKGTMGQNGYIPVFASDSSTNVSPELTRGTPVHLQYRVVAYQQLDASGKVVDYVPLPSDQAYGVALRGAVNNLVRGDQIAEGKKGPGNTAVVEANKKFGDNSSPFGLQNNLPQIPEAVKVFFAGRREALSHADRSDADPRRAPDGRTGLPDLGVLHAKRLAGDPARRLTLDGQSEVARVDIDDKIEPNRDPARFKPGLENDLFEQLLSRYHGAAPSDAEIVFSVENGKLVIRGKGQVGESGEKSFAEQLARDLLANHADNGNLRDRLVGMVKGLGGEARLRFKVQHGGQVETGSVRFESSIHTLARRAREATRASGSEGLEKALDDNYQSIFGALAQAKYFPKTVGEGADKRLAPITELGDLGSDFVDEVKANVLRLAMGGARAGDEILITRFERAADGQATKLFVTVNGREVGTVIVGAGKAARLKMIQYLLGAERVQESGALGTRVLEAKRNSPTNDQENASRLVWYTEHSPGEISSRGDLSAEKLDAFGKSLADFTTRAGEKERLLSGDTAQRQQNFLARAEQEALDGAGARLGAGERARARAERRAELSKLRAQAPDDVFTDPFYQGPYVGETTPDFVSFSRGANGEWRAGFMNFYSSRGWGNALYGLSQFTRDLSPAQKDRVIESFVRERSSALIGGEPLPEDVARRTRAVRAALPYFESLSGTK